MSHKTFDNNLVAIRKNKIVLTLNKPASIMITLKINMATIQHYLDTDSLMYEIKTEDVYKDFSSDKEMFDFRNYWT